MRLTSVALAAIFGLVAAPAFAQTTSPTTTGATSAAPTASKQDEKKAAQDEKKAAQEARKSDPTAKTKTSVTGGTQTNPDGSTTPIVNVNLSKVRIDVAKNANIDLEKVPINIQIPVEIAANVCGIDVNALKSQQGSGSSPTCTAVNAGTATQAVQNQIQ